MAIDRVPAGVADGVREPPAVHARIRIEDLFRWLVPVDITRGLRPKRMRIALPALVLAMVAAGAGIHGSLPMQQDDAPRFYSFIARSTLSFCMRAFASCAGQSSRGPKSKKKPTKT
jgi:hypothetical protein